MDLEQQLNNACLLYSELTGIDGRIRSSMESDEITLVYLKGQALAANALTAASGFTFNTTINSSFESHDDIIVCSMEALNTIGGLIKNTLAVISKLIKKFLTQLNVWVSKRSVTIAATRSNLALASQNIEGRTQPRNDTFRFSNYSKLVVGNNIDITKFSKFFEVFKTHIPELGKINQTNLALLDKYVSGLKSLKDTTSLDTLKDDIVGSYGKASGLIKGKELPGGVVVGADWVLDNTGTKDQDTASDFKTPSKSDLYSTIKATESLLVTLERANKDNRSDERALMSLDSIIDKRLGKNKVLDESDARVMTTGIAKCVTLVISRINRQGSLIEHAMSYSNVVGRYVAAASKAY